MCGGLLGGGTPKATKVAPAAQQVVSSPENTDKQAVKSERRRAGYKSTMLSDDRTILGASGQVGAKNSLGG